MSIKRILIVFISLMLLCGCTVKNISNDNIMKNVDTILGKKNKYSNKDAIGYQYYLPTHMGVKKVNDFNQEIKSGDVSYYLYADVVSYYYKVDSTYKIDKNAYISEKLNYNKKQGYLEVNKNGDNYFVEMMFNYAKIEASVSKYDLIDTISDMSYILSSVKYNNDIIETLIGDKKYDLSDNETYNIFKSKKKEDGNFLDYVNEYDNYDGDIESLIEKEEIKKDEEE